MTDEEKWNYICEVFKGMINSLESVVQKNWEDFFADPELFGYSRIKKEIDSQRQVKIGVGYKKPDIIIRNQKEDLFVVELKKSDLKNASEGEEQLLSYQDRLKLNIGILIWDRIRLIDYDYTKQNGEKILFEFFFEKDNPDGIKFVELFSKANFDKDEIKEFIRKKNEASKNVSEIRKELANSKDLLKSLLKEYFSKNYSEEEFEEAFKEFEICVEKKNAVHSTVLSSRVPKKVSKINSNNSIGTISKSDAIDLCSDNGIDVSGNITFSSTNKANGKFWANPDIRFLNDDWWLLLNDKEKGELHVLFIPSGSIDENEIVVRPDKPYQIDLQINNDDSFQDSRSKTMFGGFLLKKLAY